MSECESPIEELMLDAMTKALHPTIVIKCQQAVKTTHGNFRADFRIDSEGYVRVIEVDGRDFHDFDDDRNRDFSMLAHGGGVNEVYRFRGCDVHHQIDGCLIFLETFAPDLFDPMKSRPTPQDMVLLSKLLSSFRVVTPIMRCVCRYIPRLIPVADDTQTASVLAVGNDGMVLQFKSPYWRQ